MTGKVFTTLALLLALTSGGYAFEWQAVPPASQGMDEALLASLTARLATGELGRVDGLMVVRGGQEVYREYFRGYQGEPLPIYSVTKSVGSILIGTLVRDSLISTSAPLNSAFTQYPQIQQDPLRQQITIEHVLQQRHGYNWIEWPYGREDHPISTMLGSTDWLRTVLTWPMAEPPGQTFQYSTGASGLMSGIVLDATGLNTQAYAQQALFEPLGISRIRWGINCLDSRQICIAEEGFPLGNAPLGFGLWLTLPDMARIGLMMAQGGRFDSQQLISQDWIDASVQTYSTPASDPEVFSVPGSGYGYQWWIQPITDDLSRTFDMYYANGYGRQFIMMIPEADLVVVQLAEDYQYDGPGIGTALREHILPAITVSGQREPLSARLNGSWYDPESPAQGVNLEVLESRGEALAYWYTYDDRGNQRWLIGQGPIADDTASLELLVTTGGRPAQATAATVESWGTAELSFDSCLHGQMTFISTDGANQGVIPLSRLTGAENCASNAAKSALP
ncbi:MAG: serine hydrolase domain-containing protein [Lysobacterales bacterium]